MARVSTADAGQASMRHTPRAPSSSMIDHVAASNAGAASNAFEAVQAASAGPRAVIWSASAMMGSLTGRRAQGERALSDGSEGL